MKLCNFANKASEKTVIRLWRDTDDMFLGEFIGNSIPKKYHHRKVVGFNPIVENGSAVLDVVIEEEDN